MSVDLDFWKYREGQYLDNRRVYETACCEGEPVEGLEDLPIEEILQKVADVFSDWTRLDPFNYEGKQGAFSVFTTPQAVRFDCCGMSEGERNALIDIMLSFGCPLYDPQIGVRFDGRE